MYGAAGSASYINQGSIEVLPKKVDKLHEEFVSYINSTTDYSKPIPLVYMEHSYARAGGGGACASSNGTRLLLVRRPPQCPDCHIQRNRDDEIIDIETVDREPNPPLMLDELPYWEKALAECDMQAEDEETKPDWEAKIHNLAWNSAQSSLLNESLTIIHNTRVAILTAGINGAKRAAARGGGARSLRALLAAPHIRWQPCLAQWLHNALTELLPTPLLVCYKDIMLTMKSKVPILVEKMTMSNPLTGRIQGAENGALGPIVASANAPSDPQAPLLLMVPSGRDKRDARWAERLRAIAQVHIVHSHQTTWPPNLPITSCLYQLVKTARGRAETLKTDNPQRPLVIIGQGPGAAIAAQLAVSIPGIAGLICLGLPLLTTNGPRGMPDDTILGLSCPLLLIIGQNASNATQQDAEILRSKLRVKSRLVVAGSADELLRLPRIKRQLEGITQRMFESSIVEEISSFLSYVMKHEDNGDFCSSPESFGGPEADPEHYGISLHSTSHKMSQQMSNKYRFSESAKIHKKKKAKQKPVTIKTISPNKSRELALYEANNPPPEGAKIVIGDIFNSQIIIDDDPMLGGGRNNFSSYSKRSEKGSHIQISNNRLTKNANSITGNGSYENYSKTGIKVLENKVYRGPPIPLVSRKFQSSGTIQSAILKRPSTGDVTAPNIMDLPIVFMDDNKSTNKEVKSPTNTSYKAIIINKQQMISNPSSSQPSNIVRLSGVPTTSIVGASPPNSSMKYTKVIVAKRPSTDSSEQHQQSRSQAQMQQINKPIIVRSKGATSALSTFKVIPNNLFQKSSNVIQPKQRLIIKRAVMPSPLKLNEMKKFSESPKVDGDSLRQNAKSESAIEAAVASITGQEILQDMLEHFP